MENCKILEVDVSVSESYGTIKSALAKKGTPIPENDIWIAATAIRYDLSLYAVDNHFTLVENLNLLQS